MSSEFDEWQAELVTELVAVFRKYGFVDEERMYEAVDKFVREINPF